MFSKILFSAMLVTCFSGAAFAANGDANIDALMAQQPHSQAVSQGIPTVVGSQDGSAVIRYDGQAVGNLSAGVPVIVGNSGGEPVIVYR
jgi:hypothetical protein